MANEIKWESLPGLTTYLTTELNGITDGANKIGAAIDFDQETRCLLELHLATQGSARDTGAYVAIYLVKSSDGGTAYGYGGDALDPPASDLVAVAPFDAATTARTWVGVIDIPADVTAKLLVINETGVTLAASGNTLKHSKFSAEIQ